jgi:polyisoprenoid-binding protein YceI
MSTIRKTKWSIDHIHSEISFKIEHLMIAQIKGSFKEFDASIYTKNKDFTTVEIDLWINPTSISTGDASRDTHLKGPDFLDVIHHKQITFNASAMGPADPDGKHVLWGELTIKGISQDIKLTIVFGGMVTDPWGNEKAGFTATGKIRRSDWGLTWNKAIESGGILVGEEVFISFEAELVNTPLKTLRMELGPSTRNFPKI